MLVVLAKLGTPALVGEYAYALALTGPVFQFFSLQLRVVQATDAKHRFAYDTFASVRLISSAAALLLISIVALPSTPTRPAYLVVLAVGLSKAIESMSDVAYGRLQRDERMDVIASSMIARGILGLALLSVGVLLGGLLVGSVLLSVAWLLVLVFHDQRAFGIHDSGFWSRRAPARPVVDLIRTAMPLGVVVLLLSLNTNSPRYVIEHHLGMTHLGVFAALTYLVTAGNMVVGALGQAATPRLSRVFASGNIAAFALLVRKLVLISAGLGVAGLVIAIVAGKHILNVIYGPEYATASLAFGLVMASGMVTYVNSMLGYCLTSAGAYRVQPPLCAAELAITVACSFVLIPRFGLAGAALALGVSATAKCLMLSSALLSAVRRVRSERMASLTKQTQSS